MSGLRHRVPEQTRSRQANAADPGRSVWVSANAGSGKTYVLSRRVIRLLLAGADPSRILCLTYTRSAAANMALRIFRDLARWTGLTDEELRDEIVLLAGDEPDEARLRTARRLFARALETPGGLKIQTIHAFCEAVLHQFPLEANIAGHFELIDERAQAELMLQARRELIAYAASEADADLSQAWHTAMAMAGEAGFDRLLNEIVERRNRLVPILNRMRAEGGPALSLRKALGLHGSESSATILAAVLADEYFVPALAEAMASIASVARKATAAKFAADLARALEISEPDQRFEALCSAFLTQQEGLLAPRSPERIAAKGVSEHFPGFREQFLRYAQSLCDASERLCRLRMVEATAAAMTLSEWLIIRYERMKSRHGYLDFEDLIARTAGLLSRAEAGAWVQYKLDRGLDHILIDEAQDTSPDQWQVVRKLVEEFFAGEGARGGLLRTLFAVGDEKQSIYSFQGAEPAAFAETGMEFATRVAKARRQFERVHLRHSFRSVPDVLSAVDLVFSQEEARKGLTLYPEEIEHPAIRAGDPGHVEVWPQFAAERSAEPEDWTEAIDHASLPASRLAEAMARRISGWLEQGELLLGRDRQIRPGDIMILVRKRGSFIHALSRSLKSHGVAVAGADRLKLSDHIAVKDLIALGRFVLQPEDDLSLAALLRSPIFGFSDDQLFRIAHGRRRRSLWRSLLRASAEDELYRSAAGKLSRWRVEAGFKPVYEFYAGVLGRDGVRAALLSRLGSETAEILDEFVSFILACERAGATGLGSFLETLENSAPEIKREIPQARDEVRIMTVHAAKGLEAPIVFLVDNGSKPFDANFLPALLPWHEAGTLPRYYLWRTGKSGQNNISLRLESEYRARQEEEYRRLLYVGMTRAEDRLIVCGYHGLRQPDDGTWHAIVSRALQTSPHASMIHNPLLDAQILHYAVTSPRAFDAKMDQAAISPQAQPVSIPEELLRPLPPDPDLPRPLAPSRFGATVEEWPIERFAGVSPVFSANQPGAFAAERGAAVHRLLQFLPEVPVDRREATAEAYLQRIGPDWPADLRADMVRSVVAILSNAQFSEVFGVNSQAEVEIAGQLTVRGRERAITGRIDRLAFTETGLLFVDYKSGGSPKRSMDEIPAEHVVQLALYGALLRQIYPEKAIRAGLLYTETPVLFELDEDRLAHALELLSVT